MATEAFYGRHAQSRTPERALPPQPEYSYLYDETNHSPQEAPYESSPFGQLSPEPISRHYSTDSAAFEQRDNRQYSDDIPLRQSARPSVSEQESLRKPPNDPGENGPQVEAQTRRRGRRELEKTGLFSGKIPWVVYGFTAVQVSVFIAELVKNAILTRTPIEIQPQVNPMLGPSIYVLINMGARYVPCMKHVDGIPGNITWPCPWTTTDNVSDPMNSCTLSELCGFGDTGNQPAQWFRFITPMFLHAGIVHIAFNMLLQFTIGREMEKIIGSVRFLIVYLSSGIFGFVLGGNFAATGIASMGASGALFGVIAIMLLDLLYTWKDRESPVKELAFIILDIVISFVLGLLPGLDNFSHIGGFLMGLVLGVCILHSPNLLRERVSNESPSTDGGSGLRRRRKQIQYDGFKEFFKSPLAFFGGRKAWWWAWWLVRAAALMGVLISFVVLINNFYINHNTCSWCKYLSCLPVKNWCDVGNIQIQYGTSPSRRSLLDFPAPGELNLLF